MLDGIAVRTVMRFDVFNHCSINEHCEAGSWFSSIGVWLRGILRDACKSSTSPNSEAFWQSAFNSAPHDSIALYPSFNAHFFHELYIEAVSSIRCSMRTELSLRHGPLDNGIPNDIPTPEHWYYDSDFPVPVASVLDEVGGWFSGASASDGSFASPAAAQKHLAGCGIAIHPSASARHLASGDPPPPPPAVSLDGPCPDSVGNRQVTINFAEFAAGFDLLAGLAVGADPMFVDSQVFGQSLSAARPPCPACGNCGAVLAGGYVGSCCFCLAQGPTAGLVCSAGCDSVYGVCGACNHREFGAPVHRDLVRRAQWNFFSRFAVLRQERSKTIPDDLLALRIRTWMEAGGERFRKNLFCFVGGHPVIK